MLSRLLLSNPNEGEGGEAEGPPWGTPVLADASPLPSKGFFVGKTKEKYGTHWSQKLNVVNRKILLGAGRQQIANGRSTPRSSVAVGHPASRGLPWRGGGGRALPWTPKVEKAKNELSKRFFLGGGRTRAQSPAGFCAKYMPGHPPALHYKRKRSDAAYINLRYLK